MPNTVNILGDGSIEIRFAQPLKNNAYNIFFFGNVRGITLEVLKDHIVGIIFKDQKTLETFYEFNGVPGFSEVKNIVEKLRSS